MSEWKTIDSVPEDEDFLGFRVGLGVVQAVKIRLGHPDHKGFDFYSSWDFSPIQQGFTHWMPIPPPPAD